MRSAFPLSLVMVSKSVTGHQAPLIASGVNPKRLSKLSNMDSCKAPGPASAATDREIVLSNKHPPRGLVLRARRLCSAGRMGRSAGWYGHELTHL